MGKVYDEITPELRAWIEQQRVFFVATAPTGLDGERGEGHVNCSPKGLDSFRVLGPTMVAYLDLTGSGAETIAHLRENGRICLMFCALEGPPLIVRLHGTGTVVTPEAADWREQLAPFAGPLTEQPGARSIIRVECTRVSDSCGYGVPRYEFADERDTLGKWCTKKGDDGLAAYQQKHNLASIDGLPALTPE
ncbi:MAG: pyridoxamine 5'-phosphate oxidase family protein [Planctomycetota bacterium]